MTAEPTFAQRLAAMGITQTHLRDWIYQLTGRRMPPVTTSRWASGERRPSAPLEALLAVIERPELVTELRQAQHAPKKVWSRRKKLPEPEETS